MTEESHTDSAREPIGDAIAARYDKPLAKLRKRQAAALNRYIRLPGTPKSVERARNLAAGILGPEHPAASSVVLLISEAVTNAVKHTASKNGSFVLLVVDNGAHVRVEVIDEGAPTVPTLITHPDDGSLESGRGVFLIDALATEWGFDRLGGHGCLWFEVACPGP